MWCLLLTITDHISSQFNALIETQFINRSLITLHNKTTLLRTRLCNLIVTKRLSNAQHGHAAGWRCCGLVVDQPCLSSNQGPPVPALVLRLVHAGLRRRSHPQASLGTLLLPAPPNKSSLSLFACVSANSVQPLLPPSLSLSVSSLPFPIPPRPPKAFRRAYSPFFLFLLPLYSFYPFPSF